MSDQQPNNVTHLNRDPKTLFGASSKVDSPRNDNNGHFTHRLPSPAPKRPFVAKGHDAQLMEAQHDGLQTTIVTVSGGEYVGIIVKRDKFTITLRHDNGAHAEAGQDEIFYKHAIEGVRIRRSVK